MTDDERVERVRELRSGARIGRNTAQRHGAGWSDYSRIMQIADDMEAEARQLAQDALYGLAVRARLSSAPADQ